MTDYQKYINALRKCAKEHENDKTSFAHIIVSDLCRDTATLLEALEQEPKSGHWITKDGKEQGYDIGGVKTWYIQIMCSECGFIKTAIEGHTEQYHYCPNCGARMFEPQESEVTYETI